MMVEPLPVVVCSGHVDHGSELAAEALSAGAVEVFPKAKLGVKAFLEESADALIGAVERALHTRLRPAPASDRTGDGRERNAAPRKPASQPASGDASPVPSSSHGLDVWTPRPGADRVVLIGASLGGPRAVETVLRSFPANGPPCVVVQHMLDEFTHAFAARLDGHCSMKVSVAEDGAYLARGLVLVAPGGGHTTLERTPSGVRVRLVDDAPVKGHRPSVDVLFESAARTVGRRSAAALLTGMGTDGAHGLLALRRAGARTVVQDESTSVVFGMPRYALALGAADEIGPIDQLGDRLLRLARPDVAPSRGGRPPDNARRSRSPC
jgi:two-component system chemotaxis response regulator CheB